jgi:hypothetical protein
MISVRGIPKNSIIIALTSAYLPSLSLMKIQSWAASKRVLNRSHSSEGQRCVSRKLPPSARWRLTGALLDRLTHQVNILKMNGDSYRLKQSKKRQRQTATTSSGENAPN